MNYHNNSTTNKVQRLEIQSSSSTISNLSKRFCVTSKTISKWKHRSTTDDVSSRPHTIHYALTEGEQHLFVTVRQFTWLPADDLVDLLKPIVAHAGHSNVSRTFKRFDVHIVPKEKREETKQFKSYKPGYIHIDMTYIPKLEGTKKYVFVAIDRATRLVLIRMSDGKSQNHSEAFLKECIDFFPFTIKKILTDNGSEFTNKLYKYKTNVHVKNKHKFDLICEENMIEHRFTKIKSPWTNGLVERMNRTIKDSTINIYRYNDYDELKKSLLAFEKTYNMFRKHKSLGRKTPYQVTLEWYQKKPKLFKYHPEKLLSFYKLKGITW
jgi:transposase InsO family protein